MSHGVAVRQKDSAGGTQLGGGQDFFFVEGREVILVGDPVQPHGEGEHGGPVMAEGSGWFYIKGISVCREGHRASCGHPTTGREWFRISP